MSNLLKCNYSLIIAFIAMGLISFMNVSVQAATSVERVAVCPLEINAAQDLSFLQKGLFTMLYSRLTDPGKVEVLDRDAIDAVLSSAGKNPSLKGPLNKAKARSIGKSLGVDYILFGSMTQFGNSVSLDLSMVNVKGEKPALVFSRQSAEAGAVITEMDKIATQINSKIFNRKTEVFIPVEQSGQMSFAQGQYAAPYSPASAQFISPLSKYRHVFTSDGIINGIACGDTDGDKKQEVLIIYEHHIEILRPDQNGRLVQQAKIDDEDYMDIISLDVADVNDNGFAEIFVTRIAPRTGDLESFVLEFSSGSYKKIAEKLPWHFRLINDINNNKQLFAQEYNKSGPYAKREVFRVLPNGSSYISGQKITVPDGFNIMSFAIDNLSGAGKTNAIFTNMYGNLKLFSETGAVEWSGDERYGGSKLFYAFVEKDESMEPRFSESKGVYFQPKNLFVNLNTNQDEDTHLLTIRNKEAADGFLKHFRKFTSGYIEVLRLSEMGLSSDVPAKKLPGQITDFMVMNSDNNLESKELWISMIKKRNSFSAKRSKSVIVAYKLGTNN